MIGRLLTVMYCRSDVVVMTIKPIQSGIDSLAFLLCLYTIQDIISWFYKPHVWNIFVVILKTVTPVWTMIYFVSQQKEQNIFVTLCLFYRHLLEEVLFSIPQQHFESIHQLLSCFRLVHTLRCPREIFCNISSGIFILIVTKSVRPASLIRMVWRILADVCFSLMTGKIYILPGQ